MEPNQVRAGAPGDDQGADVQGQRGRQPDPGVALGARPSCQGKGKGQGKAEAGFRAHNPRRLRLQLAPW